MKILMISLSLLLALSSCEKKKIEEQTTSTCLKEMHEKFKEELKCIEKGVMEVNLYRGIYANKTIYFPMTMCPACDTVAPSFGYSCEGTKIEITDFNKNVTEIKEVYNSCEQKFK